MATTMSDVEQFLATVHLDVPTHSRKGLAPQPPRFVPVADENQAVVIGSQIQTFQAGLDEPVRQAVQNAMLLAQLYAQQTGGVDNNEAWYTEYFNLLSHLGFMFTKTGFERFTGGAVQADVEKVVLELAAGLLGGPASSAFMIIKASLEMLQKLDKDSPTLTIFRRESQRKKAGRFQLSTAERGSDGKLGISLLAFTLDFSRTLTQVLFFKVKTEEARLGHYSTTLDPTESWLRKYSDEIEQKLTGYHDGFVRALQLPPLSPPAKG